MSMNASAFAATSSTGPFCDSRSTLVAFPVRPMQGEEGPCHRRRVGRRQPQVGHGRHSLAEDGVGQRLAHVAHQTLAVARREFGHVEAELLGQRQEHRRRQGAVVVLHLVQIGQGDAQPFGEGLLGHAKPRAHLAQLRAGIEFPGGHVGPCIELAGLQHVSKQFATFGGAVAHMAAMRLLGCLEALAGLTFLQRAR